MPQAVVIGGGAAGLLCAAECSRRGAEVTLIEKMDRPARKLLITGKGRCNVTNASFELDELISNVVSNPRFMYSAFSNFMPYDTMALFESLGVPLKIERGGRVFPVSDKAGDIADALVNYARSGGVKFIRGCVKAFETKNNRITAAVLDDGTKIPCSCAALCTGGMSYPLTGSTGDGYKLARSLGHTVTDLQPSLVSLVCSNGFISDLQGLSLKNISIRVLENDKEIYSDFGEMLFTHYGVSGPVVLSASAHMRKMGEAQYKMIIDLKPALDEKMLDNRLQRDFKEFSNKDFINSLSKLLPKKLIPVIVLLSKIPPGRKVNQITREERLALVRLIKRFTVNITSFRPIDEAVITRGGINVREINPKTMKSKIIDNLYFAGEIIDVDAYTGGFNLQIAFSTAVLCAENMQEEIIND